MSRIQHECELNVILSSSSIRDALRHELSWMYAPCGYGRSSLISWVFPSQKRVFALQFHHGLIQ